MYCKAIDPQWAKNASMGGIVRGCANWLLTNGHIKGFVALLQGDTPGEFYWGFSDDANKLAKSVYKLIEPHSFLESLNRDAREELLFIGLPCHASASFKFRITLVCSGAWRGFDGREVIDYRYGFKPYNYGLLYADRSYTPDSKVETRLLKPTCKHCSLEYKGDMIVGDLYGTPYNLVHTINPLFDEYIKTTKYKEITERMFNICKQD